MHFLCSSPPSLLARLAVHGAVGCALYRLGWLDQSELHGLFVTTMFS
jgi:hypothetical protein